MLDVREDTVFFLARLLRLRRRELGTRRGRRALSCHRQAVLVIRWYLDGTRLAQLAVDNAIALTEAQRQYNLLIRGVHAVAERANSLLKTTFKALRRVTVRPWRIGTIIKAALVLLHLEHGRSLPAHHTA